MRIIVAILGILAILVLAAGCGGETTPTATQGLTATLRPVPPQAAATSTPTPTPMPTSKPASTSAPEEEVPTFAEAARDSSLRQEYIDRFTTENPPYVAAVRYVDEAERQESYGFVAATAAMYTERIKEGRGPGAQILVFPYTFEIQEAYGLDNDAMDYTFMSFLGHEYRHAEQIKNQRVLLWHPDELLKIDGSANQELVEAVGEVDAYLFQLSRFRELDLAMTRSLQEETLDCYLSIWDLQEGMDNSVIEDLKVELFAEWMLHYAQPKLWDMKERLFIQNLETGRKYYFTKQEGVRIADRRLRPTFESYPRFSVNPGTPKGDLTSSSSTLLAVFDVTAEGNKDITFTHESGHYLRVMMNHLVRDAQRGGVQRIVVKDERGQTLDAVKLLSLERASSFLVQFSQGDFVVPPGVTRQLYVYGDTTNFEDDGDAIQLWLDDDDPGNINWGVDGEGNYGHGDIIFRGDIYAGSLVNPS